MPPVFISSPNRHRTTAKGVIGAVFRGPYARLLAIRGARFRYADALHPEPVVPTWVSLIVGEIRHRTQYENAGPLLR